VLIALLINQRVGLAADTLFDPAAYAIPPIANGLIWAFLYSSSSAF